MLPCRFGLPGIFYVGKPCCVLLQKRVSGIARVYFQVICLDGAFMSCLDCTGYYSGFSQTAEANATENNAPLMLIVTLFIAVDCL